DDGALAWEGEDGDVRTLSRAELKSAVDRAAAMFAKQGAGPGSRVGVYLPMLLETAVTVLALGKLQAVFTPIFSGYAAPAVASRLRAFQASHLVTADGFYRRGATIPLKQTADAALAESPTVERVIVVGRLPDGGSDEATPMTRGRDRWWHDAMADVTDAEIRPAEDTDPETPHMVIY